MTDEKRPEKDKTEQERTTYQKWYEENKERISKRRAEKYAEDKEYREKRKLEAKRYYWLNKRRATSIGLNSMEYDELDFEPYRYIDITVKNENDIRYGMELNIPVYAPSQVAEILRRSTQTLRLWFLQGYLPKETYRDARNYRVFTADQMRVFADLRHLLSFTARDFENHPFFLRAAEELAKLDPDGIRPMHKDKWRLDPSGCPWCYGSPSLQKRNSDGLWEHVQCFDCIPPSEAFEREKIEVFNATGMCSCGRFVDVEVEGVDDVVVICPACGKKISDAEIVKVEED